MKKKNFALLINLDNLSPGYFKVILAEGLKYGDIAVRRIYGDWVGTNRRPWKELLAKYSVEPIQEYNADAAITLEAMELASTGDVDGLILASYDSDFTKLAKTIKEIGKTVIGMGSEDTPVAFVNACDVFVVVDVITKEADGSVPGDGSLFCAGETCNDGSREGGALPAEKAHCNASGMAGGNKEPASTNKKTHATGAGRSETNRTEKCMPESGKTEADDAEETVVVTMEDVEQFILDVLHRDGYNGKVLLEAIALMLREQFPGFSHKCFGYKKFTGFIEAMPHLELLTIEKTYPNGMPDVYVIRKGDDADGAMSADASKYQSEPIIPLAELEQFVMEILKQDEYDGKIVLGKVKYLIRKEYPTFDERNYGTGKFGKFMGLIPGVSLVEEVDEGKLPVTYVVKK